MGKSAKHIYFFLIVMCLQVMLSGIFQLSCAAEKKIVYVDQQTGNDSDDGLTPASAVATITKGVYILKKQSADILLVGSGTYYETLELQNLGSSEAKPIWIKAEERGKTIISAMWKEAESGQVQWENLGDNIWSAKHNSSFMGSYKDLFLFHYNSIDELKATTVQDVNKPMYGFTTKSGYLYLQLPEGEDPNGQEVKLTNTFGQAVINIVNSPYLILDGFVIQGGGRGGDEGAAINADQQSDHILYRNLVFHYCRRCVQIPDYGVAEWCEYTYPNFYNFAEDLRVLNDGSINVVYTMVKKVNSNDGNAYYEGAFATSYRYVPSENVEIRYCYLHETFDAENLGQFNHASTHHNVYNHNYDDNIEMECWKQDTHHGIDLHVHDNLMLNCMAGPMSHQDTHVDQLYGPHYVYRNVIYITDPNHSHPAFVIKNKNGHEDLKIYYYHNILMNVQGENGGWGNTNWLFWNSQHRDALYFYNNIFLFDNCTNTNVFPAINTDNNLLVNKSDMAWLRGDNGYYVGTTDTDLSFLDKENLNFGIAENSIAVDKGRALSSNLPDYDRYMNGVPDVGPFEAGENPGRDWPRPMRTAFNQDPPEGFDNVSSVKERDDDVMQNQSFLSPVISPNPFNSITRIQFQIAKPEHVRVSIFNLKGQLVKELLNDYLSVGQYGLSWNATGCPSGNYFMHLQTGDQVEIKKCLLIN